MKLKVVALMISVGSFMVLSGGLRRERVPLFPEYPSIEFPPYGRIGFLDAYEGPNGAITRKEYRFLRLAGMASSGAAGAGVATAVKLCAQAAQSGSSSTGCTFATISCCFLWGCEMGRIARRILSYINQKVDAGKVEN